MASRKEQKEQARAARIAQQEQAAARAQRTRRMQIFGGATAIAVIVIVVAIVVSSSGGAAINPNSPAAKAAKKQVESLLAGIPQSGNTLGKASAPITITEYGDLECSICDVFATPTSFTNPENEQGTGWQDQLIDTYVRTGKAKFVYKSVETASSENPDTGAFDQQQIAAEAAGLQGKEWNYVELMYNQQGAEGSNYVSESYLEAIAKEIPGLDFKKWMSDRKLASLKNRLSTELAQAVNYDGGAKKVGTPTVVVRGPKGTDTPINGLPSAGYSGYTTEINAVS